MQRDEILIAFVSKQDFLGASLNIFTFHLSLPKAHWLSATFRTEMETYPEPESLSIAAFYVSSWIHLPFFPGLTNALKSNSLYKHAEVIPGMFLSQSRFLATFPWKDINPTPSVNCSLILCCPFHFSVMFGISFSSFNLLCKLDSTNSLQGYGCVAFHIPRS